MIRPELVPASWARTCPFCFALDAGGVDEATLWTHIALMHDAAGRVAAVFAEVDADWFDAWRRAA